MNFLFLANKIYAGHDVSDGGLFTCLIEMAISGVCGMRLYLPTDGKSAVEILFSEECGWVVECAKDDMNEIISSYNKVGLVVSVIGYTGETGIKSKVINYSSFINFMCPATSHFSQLTRI